MLIWVRRTPLIRPKTGFFFVARSAYIVLSNGLTIPYRSGFSALLRVGSCLGSGVLCVVSFVKVS